MSILYDFIYILPIFIVAFGLGNAYIGYMELTPIQLGFSFVLMMGVTVLKRAQRRIQLIVLGMVIVMCSTVILMQEAEGRMQFVQQFSWIGTIVTGIGIVLLVGSAVTKWDAARRIICGIIVITQVAFLLNKMQVSKIVVIASLFLLMAEAAEEVQKGWEKQGDTNRKKHLVSVVPFILACCILVGMAPTSKKPFDWTFLVRAYEKVEHQMNRVSGWLSLGLDDYGNGLAGFSESERLKGEAKENNKPVMELQLDKNAGSVIYLAGKSYQAFDKQRWSEVDYQIEHERTLDAIETIAAIQKYDEENKYDYFMRKNMTVTYQEFNTKYIFIPEKSIVGNDKIFRLNYREQGPDILAARKLGYGSKYEMNYYDMNMDALVFQSFLRNENTITKSDWEMAVNYCYLNGKSGYSYNDYLEYNKKLKEINQSEFEVSKEMQAYIQKITEGAETKVELLQRLERELRHYSYNLEVGDIPKSVKNESDFLDYFLLEKKEGYCVHYATAFVLAARYLGMPARYVKGYYVPIEGKETVTVTQSMAHAWPEVYLDGIGWMPFEPTPGFKRLSYWQTAQEIHNGTVVKMDGDSQYVRGTGTEATTEEMDNISEETGEDVYRIPWNMVAATVAGLIIFLLVCGLLHSYVRKRQYDKMTLEQKVLLLCKRNMKLIQKLGVPIKEGETLQEYGNRLTQDIVEQGLVFLECYEKCIYAKGKYELDETQLAIVKSSYEALLQMLKLQNRFKYVIYVCLQ